MSAATTVSHTPSAWRLGTVNIKPAVIICLATVFAQFALNALIAGFFYVTRGRSSENIYMAALNSALVMGIFSHCCRDQSDDLVHACGVVERGSAPYPGALELRHFGRVDRPGQRHLVGAHPDPTVPDLHDDKHYHYGC